MKLIPKRFSTKSVSIDLSNPHLWYDEARSLKRTIICHTGPTNSGKTHNALQELIKSQTGLYCGPLRLLAWEVSSKLRKCGVLCNLITGNEKDIIENATHTASTIEMADLSQYFDVVVIDEMQLIGDKFRGWAWTRALLGLQSRNIHVCGSVSMLPIIKELCIETNDELVIKSYKRLSSLQVSKKPIKSYKNIKEGDCIVGFDRKTLYNIKKKIEKNSINNKCCVIYGNLPPSTRKDQAELFNDPNSQYNYLVATDAIGMGLNLSIKRIIFSSLEKFDGFSVRKLTSAEIKQIAGRAGRYQSIYENGEVTCLHEDDMKYLSKSFQQEDKLIVKAGLFPTYEQLEYIAFITICDIKSSEVIEEFWLFYLNSIQSTDSYHNYSNPLNIINKYFIKFDKFINEFYQFLINSNNFNYYEISLKLLNNNKNNNKTNFIWLPDIKLSTLLNIYINQSNIKTLNNNKYFICNLDNYIDLSYIIDTINNITLYNKYIICKLPINSDDKELIQLFYNYMLQLSNNSLIYCNIPNNINQYTILQDDLLKLELHHRMIDCYIWLAYRYPNNFIDLKKAIEISNDLSININNLLNIVNYNKIKKNIKNNKTEKGKEKRMSSNDTELLLDCGYDDIE